MKRVFIILDGYFGQTNGKPSSNHLGYQNFWVRYTSVFDRVTIVTRIGSWDAPGGMLIEGPKVDVLALPEIRKLVPFLLYAPILIFRLFRLPRDASYILRSPGFITSLAWFVLLVRRIPFGVEIVGDPRDALDRDAASLPLSSLLNWFWTATTVGQCRTAAATAYVTASALQRRYPPAIGRPTFTYTSLDLRDEDYVAAPRTAQQFDLKRPTLVNVAMMHQNIKAQDVLLKSFAALRHQGVEANLVLVGDGDNRPAFERLANELGVVAHVRFTGLLPKGRALLDELDRADLFILPSRQEGLPRAMLEAMARGLPCVASDVGGASELVPKDELVPKGDVQALTERIIDQLSSKEKLAEQSARNLLTARSYHSIIVSRARKCFYESIKIKK